MPGRVELLKLRIKYSSTGVATFPEDAMDEVARINKALNEAWLVDAVNAVDDQHRDSKEYELELSKPNKPKEENMLFLSYQAFKFKPNGVAELQDENLEDLNRKLADSWTIQSKTVFPKMPATLVGILYVLTRTL
jgi:hypothetical protein